MIEGRAKKTLLWSGIGLAAAFIIYILYVNRAELGSVITPFVIGGVIAYLLNPLVRSLQKKKIPCWLSIILIYIFFIALLVVGTMYFIPAVYSNISDLISNIPRYTKEYNQRLSSIQFAVIYSNLPEQVKEIVMSQVQNSIAGIQFVFVAFLKKSLGAINGVFSLFINIALGLIIGFYILRDIDKIKTKASFLLPRKWRKNAVTTLKEINVVLSNYIQGQLLISLIVGTLETIGLYIAGVKYAFILGMIGGLTNLIPYFGPFIGAIPAVLIGLLDSYITAIFAVLVFLIVQQIDNALITPRIMSEKVGIHPLAIIFVVLLGGSLFGALGMLLAVPFTAIVKIIVKKVIDTMV